MCGELKPEAQKHVRATISVQMRPWDPSVQRFELGVLPPMDTREYCDECNKAKNVIEAAKAFPHEPLSEMMARMIKKHGL